MFYNCFKEEVYYIYSCYFKLNYQKNLDYKIKKSKKLESTHFSSNEIIKE